MVHPGSAVAPFALGCVRVAEVDLPALERPASAANKSAFFGALCAITPALISLVSRGPIDRASLSPRNLFNQVTLYDVTHIEILDHFPLTS